MSDSSNISDVKTSVINPAGQVVDQIKNLQKHEVGFTGSGAEYFKIWIVNILLTILTLGIYSAWAKVRNKRYFYGNTQLHGATFEYHATPIQILKGRLIAVGVLLVFTVINNFFPILSPITVVLMMLALPFVLWTSYRFNMQMSSYRNVRFGFALTLSKAYWYAAIPVLVLIGYSLFFILSAKLGDDDVKGLTATIFMLSFFAIYFSIPFFMALIQRIIISNYKYGTSQFTNDIKASEYYKIFLTWIVWSFALMIAFFILGLIIVGVLAIAGVTALDNGTSPEAMIQSTQGVTGYVVMIGFFLFVIAISVLQQAYFLSRFRNYRFNTTKVNDVELKSNVELFPLAFLLFKNSVLVLMTLGLYYPWAKVALSQMMAETTWLESTESLDQFVAEESEKISALGDELGEAFDTDFDLGAGF